MSADGHRVHLGDLDTSRLDVVSAGPDDEPVLTLSDPAASVDLTVELPGDLVVAADLLDKAALTLLAHALRLRRIARGEK